MQPQYNKTMIAFLILFMAPLSGVAVDLYAPSLPAITQYFQVYPAEAKFTIGIYIFGFGLGQLIFGSLSDSIGRKKPLLVGAGVYTLSSLLAIFSPNIAVLFLLRFLQGLFGSAMSVVSKAVITDCFTGKAVIKLSSYYIAVWALGPVVAPAVGGYLQHYFGWRANFLAFVILGASIFFAILVFLPETNRHKHKLHIKTMLSHYAKISRHQLFLASIICLACAYAMLASYSIFAPFLIQVDLGHTAITYGHIALLMGLSYFLGSLTTRPMIHYFSDRKALVISFSGMLVGGLIFLLCAIFIGLNLYTISIPVGFILFFTASMYPMLFDIYFCFCFVPFKLHIICIAYVCYARKE